MKKLNTPWKREKVTSLILRFPSFVYTAKNSEEFANVPESINSVINRDLLLINKWGALHAAKLSPTDNFILQPRDGILRLL